jgi:hypothetical protein
MNVFEKLNEARIRFQNAGVKKSGKNSYAGYTYYELADILPAINKIAQELKFTCVVNFTKELATLDFVDCEKNEKIQFTSPMASASLKGCHEVQNTGASETYLKRYLYQNCFEIVEADALDMTMNPNQSEDKVSVLIKKVQDNMNTFSDEQIAFAEKAIKERNVKNLEFIVSKIGK